MSASRLPDFVVIGAARSGTTTVARYLAGHPDIFLAVEKEVHFFDEDDKFDLGETWYSSQFSDARQDQIVGEATPAYMMVEPSAERMAGLIPDARLVAILRNPVDRAYSLYWFTRAWGHENRDPGVALRSAMDAEGPSDPPPGAYLGSYVTQLERFTHFYPRSALLTVLFEDFSADPVGIAGRVCGFIGADESRLPRNLGRFKNETRQIRSLPLHHGLTRVKKYAPRLVERAQVLNSKPLDYPRIDPQLRAELVEYFRPHNARLAEWLGVDLSRWNA